MGVLCKRRLEEGDGRNKETGLTIIDDNNGLEYSQWNKGKGMDRRVTVCW